MGERPLLAARRPAGDGRGRQGLGDRARDVRASIRRACRWSRSRSPRAEELDHDFLWRIAKALPERGRIGIFNRSHYEEVVALKVHPEWLEAQRLPPGDRDERFWQERYEDINAFERHLDRDGTKIVKFFLHVSKEVQKERFLARLDTPGKEWKFNAADVDERARWDDYMSAFEDALTATSTAWAPWYVIPADHKAAHPGPGRTGARRDGQVARPPLARGLRGGARGEPRGAEKAGVRGRRARLTEHAAAVRPAGGVKRRQPVIASEWWTLGVFDDFDRGYS